MTYEDWEIAELIDDIPELDYELLTQFERETVKQHFLNEQGWVCAVCGLGGPGRRFALDHDHETGLIRGVLCGSCNLRVIGAARDPGLLLRAARYLEQAAD